MHKKFDLYSSFKGSKKFTWNEIAEIVLKEKQNAVIDIDNRIEQVFITRNKDIENCIKVLKLSKSIKK